MANMRYQVSENGCYLWAGALNSRGYGVVWHEGKLRLAHRVAFLFDRGRWPADGLVTDHICNTKQCVNPSHLRELTNSQNLMRAIPRGDPALEKKRAYDRATAARRRARIKGGE